MIELPYGEINYDDMLSRFHLILEGRGTDGQTDGRTDLLYRYRASICWRAIKIDKCIICKESGGGPQNGWLAFYWIICWLQYAYEAVQQFLKWVISGPRTNINVTRQTEIEKSSRNLAQHIVTSFRSRRQVTYKAKADGEFQKAKTTPLSVGFALTSYQANRSRSDVETLNNLQVAVTCQTSLLCKCSSPRGPARAKEM